MPLLGSKLINMKKKIGTMGDNLVLIKLTQSISNAILTFFNENICYANLNYNYLNKIF